MSCEPKRMVPYLRWCQAVHNHWTGPVDWTSGLIEIVCKPLPGMNFDGVGQFRVLTGLDLNKTVIFVTNVTMYPEHGTPVVPKRIYIIEKVLYYIHHVAVLALASSCNITAFYCNMCDDAK